MSQLSLVNTQVSRVLKHLECKQLTVNFPLHKGFHLFPKQFGKHCILQSLKPAWCKYIYLFLCLFACLFTFLQHNLLAHLSYCYCWQCWLSLHPLNPRPPHCFPHACVLPKENKHIKCTSFIKQLETLLLTQKSTGKLMLTRLRPKVSSRNHSLINFLNYFFN